MERERDIPDVFDVFAIGKSPPVSCCVFVFCIVSTFGKLVKIILVYFLCRGDGRCQKNTKLAR